MKLLNIPPGHPYQRHFHLRGSTMVMTAPMNSQDCQTSRVMAMNARLEARLRILASERDKLEKLLDEANTALADAGIPYRQGNIRERINAYKVFKNVLIFPM